MVKKIMFFALLIIGGLLAYPQTSSAKEITIYVDGVKLASSSIVKNGNTLVPVRSIAEKMGLTVNLNSKTNVISFIHPYRKGTIQHKIGTNKVTLLGNTERILNTSSKVVNGTTFVPIRLFEAFDAKVHWDGSKQRIDVYSYETRMSQYITLSSLAYNNLYNFKKGTSVSKILAEIKTGFVNDVTYVQDYLYIYNSDSKGKISHKRFAEEYFFMNDWKLKTYLTASDFKESSKRKSFTDSGFDGFAFENIRTGEVVVAYRGTEGPFWGKDWSTNITTLTKNSNRQKEFARELFLKVSSSKPTLVGHSLGGGLVQGVAAYYPENYMTGYTFNAFGIGNVKKQTKKIVNFKTNSDPVSSVQNHLGRIVVYKLRPYPDDFNELTFSAHKLFNFYGYFFPSKTKYWNSTYGVPYHSSQGNSFGW